MPKYQFATLSWMRFSDKEAELAKRWYQGAGWYYTPMDRDGKTQATVCAALSDSECSVPISGQFEALNRCGTEGWSVAAYVERQSESLVTAIVNRFGPGASPCGPYFILQRREP